ncbi:MAG: hypothetical protein M1815_005115 [Lichina confinis]|nr:MAG: hypothetical protein M1815_005115 [Lichina confinis]
MSLPSSIGPLPSTTTALTKRFRTWKQLLMSRHRPASCVVVGEATSGPSIQQERPSHTKGSIFVSAMMRAGSSMDQTPVLGRASLDMAGGGRIRNHCAQHRARLSRPTCRLQHTATLDKEPQLPGADATIRQEYIDLLDYYSEPPSRVKSPARGSSEPFEAAGHIEGHSRPAEHLTAVAPTKTPEEIRAVDALKRALADPATLPGAIFAAYRALPLPRVPLLARVTIRRLLRRLSSPTKKNRSLMMQYFSVVDDVKAAGVPLTRAEWTSAIALAGRCFARVSAADVEAALHMFRSMERESGIRPNQVAFNVLFNMAAKAQKYALAELIMQEMRERGLELDRYGHMAHIFYQGLRCDGDGIRTAYRRMIDDGYIVDTVALNCVISALLNAGEAPAADNVYRRMKQFHANHSGAPLPPTQCWAIRSAGKALQRLSRDARGDPERQKKLQEKAIMAPDLRTFRLLIRHHCQQTGRLNAVTTLLEDMPWYGAPLHASIFQALFQGFALHGGARPGEWTLEQLDDVWAACAYADGQGAQGMRLGHWLIIWCLRAYIRCAGRARMLAVWDEARERWRPPEGELHMVQTAIYAMLRRGRR